VRIMRINMTQLFHCRSGSPNPGLIKHRSPETIKPCLIRRLDCSDGHLSQVSLNLGLSGMARNRQIMSELLRCTRRH